MFVKKLLEFVLMFGVLIYICFLLYLSKPDTKTNITTYPPIQAAMNSVQVQFLTQNVVIDLVKCFAEISVNTVYLIHVSKSLTKIRPAPFIITSAPVATQMTNRTTANSKTEADTKEAQNKASKRCTVEREDQFNIFEEEFENSTDVVNHPFNISKHVYIRKMMSTSNLGAVLFKYKDPRNLRIRNTTFKILMWTDKKGTRPKIEVNYKPVSNCNLNNCKFTYDEEALNSAHAVVVDIEHGEIPKSKQRKRYQKWIFLTNPRKVNRFTVTSTKINTVTNETEIDVTPLDGIKNVFNWSMSYLSYSDIPLPCGRTVLLNKNEEDVTYEEIMKLIPFWYLKTKKFKIATVINDCDDEYVRELLYNLTSAMPVDVYGRCTNNTPCSDFFSDDCNVLNKYAFYLAFENSHCNEYITRRTFYNSYLKGAIPLIARVPVRDCIRLLPPYSFLHLAHFRTYSDINKEIESIINNPTTILQYHIWRKYLEFRDEQKHFHDRDFLTCRICQALNYNMYEINIYDVDSLQGFFNYDELCRKGNEAENSFY